MSDKAEIVKVVSNLLSRLEIDIDRLQWLNQLKKLSVFLEEVLCCKANRTGTYVLEP
jgi:hypothetical protein